MTTRIVTDANGRKHITNEPLLHPPQRKPLTDEEIEKIAKPFWDGHLGYGYADFDSAGFARAIEAKLKENT